MRLADGVSGTFLKTMNLYGWASSYSSLYIYIYILDILIALYFDVFLW